MASLLDTPLGNLTSGQHLVALVSFEQSDTVATALEKLTKHKLLCAPVLDDSKNRLLGFVDVLDVMTLLVHHCTENLADSEVGKPKTITKDNLSLIGRQTKMSPVTEAISKKFHSIILTKYRPFSIEPRFHFACKLHTV